MIHVKVFTKSANLNQHKRTHTVRMKVGKFDCKLCDNIYTSNQNLGKHIKKSPSQSQELRMLTLDFHDGLIHPSSKSYKKLYRKRKLYNCKQCTYESHRKDSLKRHIETHITNRVKTGRPKKLPGELSSVTQRSYAKKSQNAFMEEIYTSGDGGA